MSKIIIGKYLSGELGVREGTQYPLDSPTIIRKIKWSVVTSRKAILDKVYIVLVVYRRGGNIFPR